MLFKCQGGRSHHLTYRWTRVADQHGLLPIYSCFVFNYLHLFMCTYFILLITWYELTPIAYIAQTPVYSALPEHGKFGTFSITMLIEICITITLKLARCVSWATFGGSLPSMHNNVLNIAFRARLASSVTVMTRYAIKDKCYGHLS